ncbi:uroporphyrinogen decarboxylase/cobalamine-independent methonine synthase family protein [Desulfoluna spongiiphila]|uniref:hypothetical protein n=1 Tax=Desulfoluna spongiiphila TaxID=419481 RepID=UPI001250FF17|nr:hypothetical protein [Desulfoluna spongiiphila]VVS92459.1 urod/mete-like superfamily [Desulfoluna spongiiphila]
MATFTPQGRPLLIGSLPLSDHARATELVLAHTPEIPLWAQLPSNPKEGMVDQFLPGFPGLVEDGEKAWIDATSEAFPEEMLAFYEAYLTVSEGGGDIEASPFAISTERARGFFALTDRASSLSPLALKGQITGPVTFGTAVKDQEDRAIFYDDQLRDIMVKHLTMNAGWQARMLGKSGALPIVFFDEPALAGFGTSAYLTITEEDVISALNEMAEAVHKEGGLAGVHVCANTQWTLLFEAAIDIISFDAYSYFDKFILFEAPLKAYLDKGGIIAWGIVPTGEKADIEKETVESLYEKWDAQVRTLEAKGFSRKALIDATLITPSCGTGSLSLELAEKVLALTKGLSEKVRAQV